jgi:hypothetical protein
MGINLDGPMCPHNYHSPHGIAAEIAELLAAPPLSLAELLEDPEVRYRIGFSISQAAARPRRRKDATRAGRIGAKASRRRVRERLRRPEIDFTKHGC